MTTEEKDGYAVNDRRGEEEPKEVCRCCCSPEVHTRDYNAPTVECINYLHAQNRLLNEMAVANFDKNVNVNDDCFLFLHSGCCRAHWELAYNKDTKEYMLGCEKCGMGPGPNVKVTGPEMGDDCVCEECKRKLREAQEPTEPKE
jgi:hypothetical protein